ncbi:preprotein translocase subunit SecA [Rhodoplanes azumiensis]|uniref:Protein translocase subunit SecA n=1 Tax=Rhodoplanes azumiensis TaxID=1897628 RepID=A0ABW5AFM9_9BRAD
MSDAALRFVDAPDRPATGRRLPALQPYPERRLPRPDRLTRAVEAVRSVIVPRLAGMRTRRLRAVVAPAAAQAERLRMLGDDALRHEALALRHRLRATMVPDRPPDTALTALAFALVREASGRILGMRHHDVQLVGAFAMVSGMIAEMDTGEGKTLTATLAAVTMALAGWPVHVVTVNDYLAKRDAETMMPLYGFFGLDVGVVVQGLAPEARRTAYACAVTYCTNKELAFDYLKDRLALGQARGALRLKLGPLGGDDRAGKLLLRGLHFAIVDEADSVFVDEARTPLILSRQASSAAEARLYEQAIALARDLAEGHDFVRHAAERRLELTAAGRARVAAIARGLGGDWRGRANREGLALQALTALLTIDRDEHYIVRDGKVQMVDEYTGRIMPDRFWTDGLHQMIEIKEGCAISGRRVTLARMTYQRFFRRYRRLSGMTGTGREIAGELWRVYGLPVARIPTHKPSRRVVLPDTVLITAEERWAAIAQECRRLVARGVPVLIGTRSVAASEVMSRHLATAGIDHVVLSAAQDAAEAEIVAQAGQPGRVTVATNIAGRGTDIKIAESVKAAGGLHVIMSERHDARRIDRQLAGRCARQGEAGLFRAILSLDDAILAGSHLRWVRALARLGGPAARRIALRHAQKRAERLHARMRRDLLRNDESLDHALAFSGKSE